MAFAIASYTPGPNNFMVMASGSQFGYRRTLPHIVGIMVGVAMLVFASGLGFDQFIRNYPNLHLALQIICILMLIYLSWKILGLKIGSANGTAQPLTFIQATLFQWINPKGLTFISTLTVANLSAEHSFGMQISVLIMISSFWAFTSASSWCLLGDRLSGFMKDEKRRRATNIVMALMLLSCIYFIV